MPAPTTSTCMVSRRPRRAKPHRQWQWRRRRSPRRRCRSPRDQGCAEELAECRDPGRPCRAPHWWRRSAHALDDSRTCLRTDCDFLAEKVEFAPGRPTFHIEIAAKSQWIDRTPNKAFDGADRGEVDDGNHLLGDVRKAMARRRQNLREPAQFIGAEPREKSLDGGTAGGGSQITPGDLRAVFPDH